MQITRKIILAAGYTVHGLSIMLATSAFCTPGGRIEETALAGLFLVVGSMLIAFFRGVGKDD